MLARSPNDVIQSIMLALFFVEADELKTSEQLKNGHILKTAFRGLVNFSLTNKFHYSLLKQTNFLEALAKQLANHLGFVFENGYEKNILQGIAGNTNLLKKFIKILTHFDIRNILSLNEHTLETNHQLVRTFSEEITLTQLTQSNPIVNFLFTMLEVSLGRITGSNLEIRLAKCLEQGLVNAKFADLFFHHFYSKKDQLVRYPEIKFINLIYLGYNMNINKDYDSLSKTLTEFGLTLSPLDTIKAVSNNKKKQFTFHRLHDLAYSWFYALAIDYHRTKQFINLLNKNLIPLRVKKILAAAQSPHPELFFQNITRKDPLQIAHYSSRLVTLYSSEFSKELHEKLFIRDKSSNDERFSIQRLKHEKRHRKSSYQPLEVLTAFRKMSKLKIQGLLNEITMKQITDSPLTFKLLNHDSVNLEHWDGTALYKLFFKSKGKINDIEIDYLAKLPFTLSLFNSPTDVKKFLISREFKILSNYEHGNFLFIKLKNKIFEAHKLKVTFMIQDTRGLSNYLSVNFDGSLLEFLTNLPLNFATWLIDKYNCDLDKSISFINTNKIFQKMLASGNLDQLNHYIKNIDFLFTLDNFILTDNTSILDYLLDKESLENISRTFPAAGELMEAYANKLLLITYQYTHLFKLTSEKLKAFHTTQLTYGNTNRTILDIFKDATPEIYPWIAEESLQYCVQLAQKEILELLAHCRHLPPRRTIEHAKILHTFEIMQANLLDEKNSILEFILKPEMQHSLLPILKFISTDHPQLLNILLHGDFLRAIANANPKHPLFMEEPLENWYELFVVVANFQYCKSNLFSYITATCNTIYWPLLKENYMPLNNMKYQAIAIVNLLEKHHSKASFFATPKLSAEHSTHTNTPKRQREDASDDDEKKQKRAHTTSYERVKTNPYVSFISALNSLNSRHEKNALTLGDEIESLQMIEQRINSTIDEIQLTAKFTVENDDELTIEDRYNLNS